MRISTYIMTLPLPIEREELPPEQSGRRIDPHQKAKDQRAEFSVVAGSRIKSRASPRR